MSTRAETFGILDMSHTIPNGDGKVTSTIDYSHITQEFLTDPLVGTGIFRNKMMGLCSSEIAGGGYYGHVIDHASNMTRYLQDRGNFTKLEIAQNRLFETGYTPDPDMVSPLLKNTGFHEGVVQTIVTNPEKGRTPLPIVFYAPIEEDGRVGFKKVPFATNFQHGFTEGGYAAKNPAIICDYHSDESKHTETVAKTGWTAQCDRKLDGHSPKATRGHVEAPGTGISGVEPIKLDTLTPLTPLLNEFVDKEQKRLVIPLNIEPMGCVFHANGPLLARNSVPETIVLVGGGLNTLNMLAYYQVHAPDAKIIVTDRNQRKLDALQQVNQNQITTVLTKSRDNSDLDYAMKNLFGKTQADLFIPMVGMEYDDVEQRTSQGGAAIWWAASMSEHSNKFMEEANGITHIRPYGGAPRTEFSAVALFDYLLQKRPEVIDAYMQYPGITYAPLSQEAAKITETWLNSGGRYIDPNTGMSSKPVFYM
jgi:hypothetical protein